MFSQIQWWCTGWKGQRSSSYSEEMNDQCIPLQSPRSDQEWQVFTPLCRQSACLTNRFLPFSHSSLSLPCPASFLLQNLVSAHWLNPKKDIPAFLKAMCVFWISGIRNFSSTSALNTGNPPSDQLPELFMSYLSSLSTSTFVAGFAVRKKNHLIVTEPAHFSREICHCELKK